jgi:hypothetical protein
MATPLDLKTPALCAWATAASHSTPLWPATLSPMTTTGTDHRSIHPSPISPVDADANVLTVHHVSDCVAV